MRGFGARQVLTLLIVAAAATAAGARAKAAPAGAGGAVDAARAPSAATDAGGMHDGRADAGVSPDAAATPAGPPGPPTKAPIPLAPVTPTYPDEAMKTGVDGDVALILTIDATGAVTDVEVEAGLPGGLTEAAIAAARAARFRPAMDAAGRPTPVRLRWLVHFTLPERRGPTPSTPDGGTGAPVPSPASPAAGDAPPLPPLPPGVERFPIGAAAVLAVHVREKGTGKELPTATVFLLDVAELLRVDAHGRAQRQLPPGAYVVVLRAPGHVQEERIERLFPGQRLDRTYFIEKERLNEYETIVRARPPRPETGVVTLQAEEIHNIPGTFGDPFRTAMLLPGVGSIVSGLGYPVIRGEAPGQTGTFIDEVKVPLLYHLGFGPAVVHPLYLQSLDFHPGNFPAEYGRFTGALIRAQTTDPAPEPQTMVSADLFKLSAFHTHPLRVADREASVSAAARYGTFAFLARAIDPTAVLEYWDYQVRADLKLAHGDLRLLLFGAQDTIGTAAGTNEEGFMVNENLQRLGFHRLALRYRGRWARVHIDAGIEAGPDYTKSTGDPNQNYSNALSLTENLLRPHAATTVTLHESFKLRFGADLLVQQFGTLGLPEEARDFDFAKWGLTPGVFVQGDWQPTRRWLIRPGIRFDHYAHMRDDVTYRQTGFDPRLSARFEVRPGLFVKGGVGVYQSPPRFIVPWPGLDGFGLERGLNRSNQASLGAEFVLPWDTTLDALVYYNWLPRVTEFTIEDNQNADNSPTDPQVSYPGRSYGLEVIARRRLGHRLFGWLTYTLARSERNFPLAGWRAADFDQTQLINAVASYSLGRSWTVAAVFHYNSGRPFTPATPMTGGAGTFFRRLPADRNLSRLPDFWRVDLRIEKREAFDTWYLDFYVDWLNISLRREATSWNDERMQAETVLLTIPTIGLQAVF